MFRAFEFEVGHFAFDHTRMSAMRARRKPLTDNMAQQGLPEPVMLGGIDQLEFRDGGANEPQGLDKTEPVGVKVADQPCLVHDETNDKMRDE